MTEKYKHKITRDIVVKTICKNNIYYSNGTHNVPAIFVENSNDWEEIKETNFKLLEFMSIETGKKHKLQKNGLYNSGVQLKDLLQTTGLLCSKPLEITKVQRISDNIEFSIGDKVQNNLTILKFEYDKYKFILTAKCNNSIDIDGNDLIKSSSKPLFITEDGVGKYFKNTYYYITVGDSHNNWIPFPSTIDIENIHRTPLGHKQFHTKKSAEQYIDENRPIYSKKQIEATLINTFIGTSAGIAIFAEIFKRNIGL